MDIDTLKNNFKFIEKNLEKIDSITSARLVLNDNKDIEEIHVVSNGKRNAKQLSRDIQSILIAKYDIEVDYKKISIAEIPDAGLEIINRRLKIEAVLYENNGQRASVTVNLSDKETIYSESDVGINTSRNIERMLVNTTLKNVEKSLNVEDVFILEDIETVEFSVNKAILVIMMCVLNGEQKKMCGSALIKEDYMESVVKATLDAINRFV